MAKESAYDDIVALFALLISGKKVATKRKSVATKTKKRITKK